MNVDGPLACKTLQFSQLMDKQKITLIHIVSNRVMKLFVLYYVSTNVDLLFLTTGLFRLMSAPTLRIPSILLKSRLGVRLPSASAQARRGSNKRIVLLDDCQQLIVERTACSSWDKCTAESTRPAQL